MSCPVSCTAVVGKQPCNAIDTPALSRAARTYAATINSAGMSVSVGVRHESTTRNARTSGHVPWSVFRGLESQVS